MRIYILEEKMSLFFKSAFMLEKEDPKGSWKYFDGSNPEKTIGLFQSSKETEDSSFHKKAFTPHPDFFDHLLGQFQPSLGDEFSLFEASSFYDFCVSLNKILNENMKVYDLSVKKQWIWHEGGEIKVSPKLKGHLNFS